jgi:hypothetical protein
MRPPPFDLTRIARPLTNAELRNFSSRSEFPSDRDAEGERMVAAHLEKLKADVQDGDHLALLKALEAREFDWFLHQHRDRIAIETWLFLEVLRIARGALLGTLKLKTGKASPAKRRHYEAADMERYDTVRRLRDSGVPWKIVFDVASKELSHPVYTEAYRFNLNNPRRNPGEPSPYAGGPAAMKVSYERVRKFVRGLGFDALNSRAR